jgi:diguanylate cyclase (GGDEF)-like protein
MPHEAILRQVTSQTLKALSPKPIVLPDQYASKFRSLLLEQGVSSEDAQVTIIQEVSATTLEHAQRLMDKTQNALGDLDGYVSTAREAIVTKDTDSLDGVLGLVHSMQAEIEQLRGEVYVDGLTRIYNRKWIFDKLLDGDGAFGFDGSMAFVDVNEFKALNDNLGHDVGDRVLAHIGKILKEAALNSFDAQSLHVARYAGDEFALLGAVGSGELEVLLRKTQISTMEKTFKAKDETFKIAFSYGVTSFTKGEDFMSVLKRADVTMYENKKAIKAAKAS